jgi:hypothetical protein
VKILCSIPHPKDCTSLYRGIGPLQTLARTSGVQLMQATEIDWTTLKAADIAFFQRPSVEAQVQGMKFAKMNGKPVWVDYDDNLHEIPLCNRRYPTYGHPVTQHNIATAVALADVITVTTPHLRDALAKILKAFPDKPEFNRDPNKIWVIPNAYDQELMPSLIKPKKERRKLVVWRGSDSHCKDLMTHTAELCRVVQDHPDWSFEFIGEPFWWTIEEIRKVAKPQQVSVTAAMDPIKYFNYMDSQAPALMIVPLEDQGFNRSKSNIAWIEATGAGAVTVAPHWPEWEMPGVINYQKITDFGARISEFLGGKYDAKERWELSRDYLLNNLTLDRVNHARMELLHMLYAPSIPKVFGRVRAKSPPFAGFAHLEPGTEPHA